MIHKSKTHSVDCRFYMPLFMQISQMMQCVLIYLAMGLEVVKQENRIHDT